MDMAVGKGQSRALEAARVYLTELAREVCVDCPARSKLLDLVAQLDESVAPSSAATGASP